MTATEPGRDDPADVWDAYCNEVPADRRSPQSALAFGLAARLPTPADQAVRGGPTEINPSRPYCKSDQSCCDFCCGN